MLSIIPNTNRAKTSQPVYVASLINHFNSPTVAILNSYYFLRNQPESCVFHQTHTEFTLGFGSLITLKYANIKTAAELELSAQ